MTTINATPLTIHTVNSAPEGSRETAKAVAGLFGGTLPNLFGLLAGSPELLTSAATVNGLLGKISLSALEQQVVEIVVSRENGCDYCIAAHKFLARRLPQQPIQAAVSNGSYEDAKLAVLADFTSELVEHKGRVSPATRAAFAGAGYGERQQLEVILITGLKTWHNLVNNLADTPIDALFTQGTASR